MSTATPVDRDDRLYEVVDGEIVEKTMGAREYWIANVLGGYLIPFVRDRQLGRAMIEYVFRINAATNLQRRPDAAFVTSARWPLNRSLPDVPVWDMVPDLAVEVVSPSNSASEVQRKIHEYFGAGVVQVWVVYPEQRQIYQYASPTQIQVITAQQELDGGELLPGFRLPLRSLFEDDPE
jgi:Uma2 family endonuclease